MEDYSGVKFRTVFLRKKPEHDPKNKELISWCRKLDEMNLCPCYENGNSGNLSFRKDKGFVITPSCCFYKDINEKDLVHVIKADNKIRSVFVKGIRKPSSEAVLHLMIYKKRPEINAVFHGHSKKILKKEDEFICTEEEKPYGTIELVDEVEKIIDKDNFLIMKNHGFISLGKTMKGAGERVLRILACM
ncbi:hypothetical protein GF327_07830 [Candidatus Woesearchaeota archaeon]|nr:hypothetical protein [Candidatus Woesearchaeota archaeon]